jgi:hypothetical protein
MATLHKIMGQSAPAANVDTTLYTVPTAKDVSLALFICNRGGSAESLRVAVLPVAGAIQNQHYLAYNMPLASRGILQITGITLGEGNVIIVRNSGGNISFTAMGLEIDR